MNRWKVSVCSLLILSLILLTGMVGPNVVYAKTTTKIKTTPSATTIQAGKSVTDSATFTLGGATAHGTVTYSLFSGSTCSGTPLQSKIVTISSPPTIPPSPAFTINVVGSYSLEASYSGDATHTASSSACEIPLTVTIATPTVSTSLSSSPIAAGGSVIDSATLAMATSTAHGTMTYQVFFGPLCTVQIDSSTGAVANGIAQPSKAFSDFNSKGVYYFDAIYSGDQNNLGPVTSSCETLTVTKASPTISTALLPPIPATIVAGQSVTDSATLAGATPIAGGTVTYVLYKDTTCTAIDKIATSTVTVKNGVVPNSMPFVISDMTPKPHKYSIAAFYSGDPNNNVVASACENPITVNKVSPTVSTQLSVTSITPGSGTVTDTATLTGTTANAGGTVTISMYTGNSLCTLAMLYTFSTPLTVTNGMPVSWTPTFSYPIPTGVYSFQAAYSGDDNNKPATSPCNEFLTVALSPTVITTQLSSSSITVLGTVTDQATLSGVTPTAAGTVNYYQYNGGSCSGSAIASDVGVPVSDGSVSASTPFSTSTVGFYSFQASYISDGDNAPATSSCEILTVNPAPTTISTILSSTTIVLGNSVTDSAALFGPATSSAGGTVTISMYTGSTCQVGGTYTGQEYILPVSGGVVNGNNPTGPFTPAATGTYSFRAVYSGDPNNQASTAPCEVLTVNP